MDNTILTHLMSRKHEIKIGNINLKPNVTTAFTIPKTEMEMNYFQNQN